MSSNCGVQTIPVGHGGWRHWLERMADIWAAWRHACQAAMSARKPAPAAPAWIEEDARALAEWDQRMLRDVAVPDWLREEAAATRDGGHHASAWAALGQANDFERARW